ncbi:MAG: Ig-like domain-containing protein [Pseudomonadota bacterium]|nr:Ig-like domain-containing protein [Pseudomonadota bacterium]
MSLRAQQASSLARGPHPGPCCVCFIFNGEDSRMRNCRWISLALVFSLATLSGFATAQVTRIEERDPAITYLQNRWYDTPDERWSDGEAVGAFEAGSTMTVNFSGTGITWIGYRCACAAGTARLYMDGVFLGTVNTYAAEPEPLAEIFSIDSLAAGEHSFTIEVTGSYHASGTSAYMLVDAFDIEGSGGGSSDTVPPQLSVTSPPDGANASGVLLVTAEASDNVWVQDVRVLIDGAQQGAADTSAPYSIAIDTSSLPDGAHELRVVATDWAGNTVAEVLTIETANSGYIEESHESISYTGEWIDLNNPDVSGGGVVGSFQGGSTATVNFNGTGITWIGYRCACAAGIARVYVDDNLAGTVDTYAAERTPRAEIFSTSNLAAGEHVLRIEHTGAYHSEGTSAYLLIDAFRIANGGGSSGGGEDTTPPLISLSNPRGGTVSGTVTVSADASDDTGIAGVQFLLDGELLGPEIISPPYATSWDTTTAAEGSHYLTVRARDDAGNTAETLYVPSVEVDNAAATETNPPTVSIDAPAFGSIITSGATAIAAMAADDTGVARVMFQIEGLLLSQDASAPFTAQWNTHDLADGPYVLRALAYDHDGNAIVGAAHLLNVWNSTAPPPAGAITAPADGATVSGTIVIEAEASNPGGVASVSFISQQDIGTVGGVGSNGIDRSAPYTFNWNTAALPDGPHRLWLIVEGNDGTVLYSPLVRVVVDN